MIPKKIRRTIKVNGDEWEYCVIGRWNANVFIHNLTTNEKIDWYLEEAEGVSITPGDIKTLIVDRRLLNIDAKSS